jgi:hypothetical protein
VSEGSEDTVLSPLTEDSLPAAGRSGTDVQIRTSQVRQDLRGMHRGERVSVDPRPLRFLGPLRAPRVTLFQSELAPVPATG